MAIIHTPRACADTRCGKRFIPNRSDKIYCSRACKHHVVGLRCERRARGDSSTARSCERTGCDRMLPAGVQRNRRFCSNSCTQKARRLGPGREMILRREARYRADNHDIVKELTRRNGYKRRTGYRIEMATFSRIDVCRRDNWICQLCGEPVQKGVKYTHPLSPTLDHITPLTRGGVHALHNVQLAHLVCNQRKGARMGA